MYVVLSGIIQEEGKGNGPFPMEATFSNIYQVTLFDIKDCTKNI